MCYNRRISSVVQFCSDYIISKGGVVIQGYVKIESMNSWMPFDFDGQFLTVYRSHLLGMDSLNSEVEGKFICSAKHIIGIAVGSNDNVIFVVSSIPFKESFITQETVRVINHWIIGDDFDGVDGLSLRFPELDFFLPVSHGVDRKFHDEDGTFSARALPFSETKLEFSFTITEIEVKCSVGVTATLHSNALPPISLESVLLCRFDNTRDLAFLNRLIHKLRALFSFVCYRRTIDISSARLTRTSDDGRAERVGIVYWKTNEVESEKVVKETCPASLFGDHLGDLMQLICDEVLYLEHIPETCRRSSTIDASRFVLITAAFEWNAEKYLRVPVSKAGEEVKADIIACLDTLLTDKNYAGKRVSKFKAYRKMIENYDVGLSGKIYHALKQYRSIIDPFIKNLYGINGIPPASNSEIGDRIQTQRNNYAHGKIDQFFDSLTILDVHILEWLNYCIVLKSIGLDDDKTRAVINKVFRRGFAE